MGESERPQWRVLGASSTGDLHARNGDGCDDAHGWRIEDGLTVVAIADGAGSRPGTSALGAHVAVAAVLDLTIDPTFRRAYEADPELATVNLFRASSRRVVDAARNIGCDAGYLATTLSVALAGDQEFLIGQVGDGIATVELIDGSVETVAIADRPEYVNETSFLTSHGQAGLQLNLYRGEGEKVSGFALATDGLRYKILEDTQAVIPFTQFYVDTWAYARRAAARSAAIQEFLDAVDDQTGDDKTLVVAVRSVSGEITERYHLSSRPKDANRGSHDRSIGAGENGSTRQRDEPTQ